MDSRIIDLGIIWVIILMTLVFMFSRERLSRKKQITFSVFLCLVFVTFGVFRNLGLDLPNYKTMYATHLTRYTVSTLSSVDPSLLSYEPLNYVIGSIFGKSGFRAYLFVLTTFTSVLALLLSCKQKNPILYFGSFVILNIFAIDQTRQFGAEGFILLSYFCQGTLFAVIIACFSGLLHYGTFPAVISVLLRNRRFSQVGILGLTVFGIAVFYFASGVVLDHLGDLDGGLSLASRADAYISGGFYSATNAIRLIAQFFPPLAMLAFAIYFSAKYPDSELDYQKRWVLRSVKIAGVVFVCILVGMQSDVLSVRLFGAITIGIFLLFGHALENAMNKNVFTGIQVLLVTLNVLSTAYYFYIFIA